MGVLGGGGGRAGGMEDAALQGLQRPGQGILSRTGGRVSVSSAGTVSEAQLGPGGEEVMFPPALARQGGFRGAGNPARLCRRDLRQQGRAEQELAADTTPQPCLCLLRSSLRFSFPFAMRGLLQRGPPQKGCSCQGAGTPCRPAWRGRGSREGQRGAGNRRCRGGDLL